MARAIDDSETDRRLDFYLNLDAELIRKPNPFPILH
jgi:tRNA-(ms[2]io[6]A)-hydroxylase